jgi:uncharacterized protein YcbK (DUF882 family)
MRESEMKLSPNFDLSEFISPNDPGKPGKNEIKNLTRLCVEVLEPLRAELGKPIKITSGWRSKEHNAKIGGAPNSQHTIGIAADIHVPGDLIDQCNVAKLLIRNPKVGGIGLYAAKNIVHVDIRARNNGQVTSWLQDALGTYRPIPGNMMKVIRG